MLNDQKLLTISSKLPSLHAPLKERWKTSLSSKAAIITTPCQLGDIVTVRCGDLVAGLDVIHGKIKWQKKFGAKNIESRVFISCPDAIITATNFDNDSKLTAFSWDNGRILWQSHLPGYVMDNGVAIAGHCIYVFNATAKGTFYQYHLQKIDLLNGKYLWKIPAPSGADHPLVVDNRLLFGSRSLLKDQAGLYVMELNSQSIQRVLDLPVGRLRAGNQIIVAAIESAEKLRYRVSAILLSSLQVKWSADNCGFSIAADSGEVAHVDPVEESGYQVVLKEEVSGKVLWKSDFLQHESRQVFFSSDAICVQDKRGISIFNRKNGVTLGRVESPQRIFSWGAAISTRRLIVGHMNEVICYSSVED